MKNAITVKNLIKELKKFPPNTWVDFAAPDDERSYTVTTVDKVTNEDGEIGIMLTSD